MAYQAQLIRCSGRQHSWVQQKLLVCQGLSLPAVAQARSTWLVGALTWVITAVLFQPHAQ